MKNVLVVTSESLPFIKTGGTSDVVRALAYYINEEEFDLRVIMPDYLLMRDRTKDAKLLAEFKLRWGDRDYTVSLKQKGACGTAFYFVHCDEFFSNELLYTNNLESVERFCFFQKAALTAMPLIGFKPDVVHGNDWEGSMLEMFMRLPELRRYYENCSSLLTIHNIFWQGEQCMRIGIQNSTQTMTVSQSYLHEIIETEAGEGMQKYLKACKNPPCAIMNGCDYSIFDPQIDANIENYGEPSGKLVNKLRLQEELGLEPGSDKLLIAIVSRMVEQKGIDLLMEIFDELMLDPAIEFVFLGDGEQRYLDFYEAAAEKYPGRVAALTYYSTGPISHQVYASADAYLMPSRFEPCGISQLIAMKYGTVPIVRYTGGLRDSVNEDCGFGFEAYASQELLATIKRAAKLFEEDREAWNVKANAAMQMNFSAESMARSYEELYTRLCEKQQ